MKGLASAAGTGLAGSTGGMLATGNLSLTGLAIVTGVSCLFGMLSSASRLSGVTPMSAVRIVLMNGGAVWIAAFSIAASTGAELASAALIGLGVGLAGTKVLEVIENSAVAIALRVSGKQPMSRKEVETIVGELRDKTQAAIAERAVKARRPAKRKSDGDDDQHS